MKIWIKTLIGIIIGVLLAVFLPHSAGVADLFRFLSQLVVQIGRYLVFPLVFFGLVIGTYELRRSQKLAPVYGRMVLYLVLSTLLLVLIGVATVLIFSPARIPILIEKDHVLQVPGFQELLLRVFPSNLFAVFVESGNLLLPVLVFSFLLGVNLEYDARIVTPVLQLFDSLSRIFYHINSLLVELLGIGLIAVTTNLLLSVGRYDLSLFRQLLTIISIDVLLVVLGVYPIILYLAGEKENPFRWLYAATAPALTALVTGDEYLSLTMLIKHGKESFGVPRRVGSAVYPFFAYFGRAGTAMITGVSFILILKSYSSLEITFLQVLWTIGFSFLVSLALGPVPGASAFVSISLLCSLFGKGLQEGYLILNPIAPLLISAGVLLDVLTSAFISLLISRYADVWEEVDLFEFI